MKPLLPLLAVSGAVLIAATAWSSKIELPHFKGGYPATAIFEIVGEKPDNAVLSTSVRPSKSARKLKMRIAGTADPSDTPVPVDATLKFTDKGKVTSNSFMMGYYGPTNTAPAKFRKKGNVMTFTLKSGAGGASLNGTPVTGSVKYRCRLTRKSLSIVGSGVLLVPPANTPIVYLVNLSGTRPK
jgi:hypothetical protein